MLININETCIKSVHRKIHGRHLELVDRYGISISQKTENLFFSTVLKLSQPSYWILY